jgi:hypothetical protein
VLVLLGNKKTFSNGSGGTEECLNPLKVITTSTLHFQLHLEAAKENRTKRIVSPFFKNVVFSRYFFAAQENSCAGFQAAENY